MTMRLCQKHVVPMHKAQRLSTIEQQGIHLCPLQLCTYGLLQAVGRFLRPGLWKYTALPHLVYSCTAGNYS